LEVGCLRPGLGRRWTTHLPTAKAEGHKESYIAVYRSCLWVEAEARAIQIAVGSSDVTVVKLVRQGRKIVLVSVYIPPGQGTEDLRRRLEVIETLMARQKMMDPDVEFIVGGDFNRHDALRGGSSCRYTPGRGRADRGHDDKVWATEPTTPRNGDLRTRRSSHYNRPLPR